MTEHLVYRDEDGDLAVGDGIKIPFTACVWIKEGDLIGDEALDEIYKGED